MKLLEKYNLIWICAFAAALFAITGFFLFVSFRAITAVRLALLLIGALTVSFLCACVGKRLPRLAFFGVLIVSAVWFALDAVAVNYPEMSHFAEASAYRNSDIGKENVFSGRKVLFIVPHEDDEINLAGGVISEYANYGSEVYILFFTNGDFTHPAEVRIHEALNAAEAQGVPVKNVIFLGYGDRWAGEKHLYNMPDNAVGTSIAERKSVYGIEEHPPFNPGHTYTRRNAVEDLKNVMLSLKPDTIFCSDYELHPDHKALSLFFDIAMNELLKENTTYYPCVFKGYTYSTAYFAEDDFYSPNIKSTKYNEPLTMTPFANVFAWGERVRLPVNSSELSHSMKGCGQFRAIACHKSQSEDIIPGRVISGDRVFWQREVNSLCRNASFTASSGKSEVLNDFRLYDSSDILTDEGIAMHGVWFPDADDLEHSFTVSFDAPVDIFRLRLYDNPSIKDNVLNARIEFPDGMSIETGPLNRDGSGTEIIINAKNVSSFKLKLTETEGEYAGLSEIETFEKPYSAPFSYIKLIDREDNFVYDYTLSLFERGEFPIAFMGLEAGTAPVVSCDGKGCRAEAENGVVSVKCPIGRSCHVRVDAGDASDEIFVSRPLVSIRAVGQFFEKIGYELKMNNYVSVWVRAENRLSNILGRV